MILADRIRKYVLDTVITPARQQGRAYVVVRSGDIHKQMGLKDRMPAVCGALDAEKFLDYANVRLVERSGPYQGATVEWVFEILEGVGRYA